jgi:hypothetical protein
MSAVIPQQRGVERFSLPRTIIKNGNLKTLSGNALALFIAISYRCYRTRSPGTQFTFRELFGELELGAKDIGKAAKELRAACLIHYQQDANVMFFQIQQPDGSKAKSYLRDPPAEPQNQV